MEKYGQYRDKGVLLPQFCPIRNHTADLYLSRQALVLRLSFLLLRLQAIHY